MATQVDPNWLLSTTAQSAAALVGIVGGFLVSRVIAIASERQALVRRGRELGDLIELNKRQADELRQRRLDDALWKFGDAHARRIVIEGIEDVDELIDEFQPAGSTVDDLQDRGPELVKVIRTVAGQLRGLYGEGPYPTSRRALADDGVPMTEGEPWIYETVAELLDQATAHRRGDVVALMRSSIAAPTGRSFSDQQDEREREEEHLRATNEALVGEAALVDIEADRLRGAPRGVLPGVTVLTFFGAVGILWPLFEMSRRPVAANASTRIWTFAAFTAGFASLIAYLFWVVVMLPRGTRTRADRGR